MNYPKLEEAIAVIQKLRDPKSGCPWDLEQTHESLLKYLIEESYEYLHAVESKDTRKMQEELGDVLLQILLHAQIAKDEGTFTLENVAQILSEKMIRRHPHVFDDPSLATNSKQVLENWESIKASEKKSFHKNFINDEDTHMPALMSAQKIGKKSKKINFDWECIEDVMLKVEEELDEVKVEIANKNHDRIGEELGDLLFSVTQLARHLGHDAETILRSANKKFIKRINLVEDIVKSQGKEMTELTVPELESIWQQIKKNR